MCAVNDELASNSMCAVNDIPWCCGKLFMKPGKSLEFHLLTFVNPELKYCTIPFGLL